MRLLFLVALVLVAAPSAAGDEPVLLKRFPAGMAIENLTRTNRGLFFSVASAPGSILPQESHGLWRSDGTATGTVPVFQGIGVNELTAVNGTLFFAAGPTSFFGAPFIATSQVWKSDGTPEGTVLVKSFDSGTVPSSILDYPAPAGLTNVNGVLFFTSSPPSSSVASRSSAPADRARRREVG
jgi:ELWxxDGT repeat protein